MSTEIWALQAAPGSSGHALPAACPRPSSPCTPGLQGCLQSLLGTHHMLHITKVTLRRCLLL